MPGFKFFLASLNDSTISVVVFNKPSPIRFPSSVIAPVLISIVRLNASKLFPAFCKASPNFSKSLLIFGVPSKPKNCVVLVHQVSPLANFPAVLDATAKSVATRDAINKSFCFLAAAAATAIAIIISLISPYLLTINSD